MRVLLTVKAEGETDLRNYYLKTQFTAWVTRKTAGFLRVSKWRYKFSARIGCRGARRGFALAATIPGVQADLLLPAPPQKDEQK